MKFYCIGPLLHWSYLIWGSSLVTSRSSAERWSPSPTPKIWDRVSTALVLSLMHPLSSLLRWDSYWIICYELRRCQQGWSRGPHIRLISGIRGSLSASPRLSSLSFLHAFILNLYVLIWFDFIQFAWLSSPCYSHEWYDHFLGCEPSEDLSNKPSLAVLG